MSFCLFLWLYFSLSVLCVFVYFCVGYTPDSISGHRVLLSLILNKSININKSINKYSIKCLVVGRNAMLLFYFYSLQNRSANIVNIIYASLFRCIVLEISIHLLHIFSQMDTSLQHTV